jgi:hypothetical protein
MGGSGSGRHYHCGSKSTTADYRSLDVRRLQRDGLLKPGQAFSWQWSRNGEKVASIQVRTEINRIILSYRHRSGGEEWQDKEYPVRLDWTDCNYGGQRAWFLCPAAGCGRRVAVLYNGGIFACRHCYRLAYESQREDAVDLMARRAEKIRARLGWDAGILNLTGQKPRGMRWQSYWQLCREYETLAQIALNEIDHKFGFFKNRSE